jgi:8-oxo-dGTP pyrophosphatase MutT (NUDIX family)
MNVIGQLNGCIESGMKVVQRTAVRVVVSKDDSYLMVQSRRYGDVKFPGGGVEPGEHWVETAQRECREETGYLLVLDSLSPLGVFYEKRQGNEPHTCLSMESIYYRAVVQSNPQDTHLQDYEVDYGYQPIWISLAAACQANEQAYQKYARDVPWCPREMAVMTYLQQM